jgi:hypothetical protein
MIAIRKAADRGQASFGWLDSRHTFSFGHYYDPRFMGFGPLRVINEDRVVPGAGFGTHGHQNMEIISYVLDGALQHKDSIGTGSVIRPGDVQKMSAGSGIQHSEFNASQQEPVHFLQIWIEPNRVNVQPSYAQQAYTAAQRQNQLCLVASPDGADGSIALVQDARLYASLLDADASVRYELPPGRRAWVQVARGALSLNGVALAAGDGAAIQAEASLELRGIVAAEVLLFDLP